MFTFYRDDLLTSQNDLFIVQYRYVYQNGVLFFILTAGEKIYVNDTSTRDRFHFVRTTPEWENLNRVTVKSSRRIRVISSVTKIASWCFRWKASQWYQVCGAVLFVKSTRKLFDLIRCIGFRSLVMYKYGIFCRRAL